MAPDPDRRTQLLRGVLDTCLLALLARTPTHAYDLVVLLERHGIESIGYGTVYPLMGRLRRQGLVEEHVEPSPNGPPRKVYSVSAAGHVALAEWAQQWNATSSSVRTLLATAGALPDPELASHVHS